MTREQAIAEFVEAADPSSFRVAAWIDRFVALDTQTMQTLGDAIDAALVGVGQVGGGSGS
jgi:hypothetical protein